MNILLNIGAIIALLIILLLIVAAFVKKEYSIQRTVAINRSCEAVFDYVRLLKNQDHYNKWWTMDPDAKKEYRGTDGTVGFVAAWDSEMKQAGKGEQEIMQIEDCKRIDFEIRFIKPFEGIADVYMALESLEPEQTRLTWVFKGKNKYPMNLMNLFMENMLGKDLEASAVNLKTVL
ncbi:MAG: polyketide cyclase, partial [Sediminibacterium sp.]|nr:polyketide cyclase [Sediminibacterium sp.]